MQLDDKPSTAAVLGRGVLAGLAGTVIMTAFQKLIEMPLKDTARRARARPAPRAVAGPRTHPTVRRRGTQPAERGRTTAARPAADR
jgi:hypothetical protein